jgi:lipopolysaccharide export LptBFGC system permease protein LptF
MSHRRVLVPAFISGLVLAGALAVLSDRVIPRYLRSMDEMVAQDAARLMVSSINRGDAVKMDRTFIYADSVIVLDPRESGATNLLYLTGLLLVQLDKRGDVEIEGSAPEAHIWFYRDAAPVSQGELTDDPDAEAALLLDAGSVTRVIMEPKGFVGRKRGEVLAQQETVQYRKLVRNQFRDDPKFFGFADLSRLRHTPERIGQVNGKRRLLAAKLGERATTIAIEKSLVADGRVQFTGSENAKVVLEASHLLGYDGSIRYWTMEPIASGPERGKFMIEITDEGGRPRMLRAARARIRTSVSADRDYGLVAVTLRLEDVSPVARSGAPTGGREEPAVGRINEKDIAGLVLTQDAVKPLLAMGSYDLLAAAEQHLTAHSDDDYVRGAANELRVKVEDLQREITSKQHERVAVCVACLVMVLTGAVMAMRLKDALPLTVYLWSFFPALGAVITISAGQQLTHELGSAGLLLLWGGVVAQGAFTFVQYRELARR